ncbi:uncharacterized protein [Haliotis asinina]|uniref:uncharacterized protein n=1 Tax=Haliotis asinina TaxID=109174 RepID=UPI0035323BE1
MNGYIYRLDGNVCFQVYTGYVLSFDYAEYMCNYLTGGAGALAVLSTSKKFKAVQHYLRHEYPYGDYFWVGSEQWKSRDNYSYYWLFIFYYYFNYNYWADSLKVDKSFWAPGQPDRSSERCNAITRNGNLQLMDSNCANSFDYICDIPVLEVDRPSECTSSYIFHRDSYICYKPVHYEVYPSSAPAECAPDGHNTGRLVILDTMEKFTAVTDHLAEVGETEPYIVGASQASIWSEANYWDDGSHIDGRMWAEDEPSSILDTCADLRKDLGYKLNDVSCILERFHFICEIPITRNRG